MYKTILVLFLIFTAFAATDPWAKVKDLKTGQDLRIYKIGAKQPVLAKFDELTDSGLVVIIKNEQVGIDRDDIDRIDARPDKDSRVSKESRTTTELPGPVGPRPAGSSDVPGNSTSSSVSVGSKPDFENVYRRTAVTPEPAPKK
ncbi:MAG: hypothetical protein ABSH09_08405 [Bryobacteraceae bacterium]|jgi:hypothetical protein